jgi:hypothetical protein
MGLVTLAAATVIVVRRLKQANLESKGDQSHIYLNLVDAAHDLGERPSDYCSQPPSPTSTSSRSTSSSSSFSSGSIGSSRGGGGGGDHDDMDEARPTHHREEPGLHYPGNPAPLQRPHQDTHAGVQALFPNSIVVVGGLRQRELDLRET